MKKTLLFFALATGTHFFAFAQEPANFYKFRSDLQAGIEKDTTAWKYQTAAVSYAFIGDHKNTLLMWDNALQGRPYVPKTTDSSYFKNAKQQNARSYIIKRAKKEQLIIINEAHHNPMHRQFTSSLLKDLYRQGYRYLGLEAISDSLINKRNYATNESGYYTNEPEFGNMIYEARKLGFIIFGYEAAEGKNGKEREIEQAKNIQQFMQEHSKGKVIIHCGFDHVFEGAVRNWEMAMAGRLKAYTGIDPFTIDQVKFSERSSPELSHYFVSAAATREAFVLVDAQKDVFSGMAVPPQTDLAVIHPLTHYKQARPHWRTSNRKAYWLPEYILSGKTYPIQVLAYRDGEQEKGIPADIIELKDATDKTPLYLPPGKYTLQLRNEAYGIIDSLRI